MLCGGCVKFGGGRVDMSDPRHGPSDVQWKIALLALNSGKVKVAMPFPSRTCALLSTVGPEDGSPSNSTVERIVKRVLTGPETIVAETKTLVQAAEEFSKSRGLSTFSGPSDSRV